VLYTAGHIPGAVEVDWTADLNDSLRRDYLDRNAFQALMSRIGATPDTTLIFYGDKNNWWATYAFWVFQLFGHHKAKTMDGGRLKWISFRRSLASLSLTPLALFSSIIWIRSHCQKQFGGDPGSHTFSLTCRTDCDSIDRHRTQDIRQRYLYG